MKGINARRAVGRVLIQTLAVAVLLAGPGAPCFAAQEQPKLAVRVTSPQADLLPWEPLVLDVEIRNVGATNAILRPIMPLERTGLLVKVRVPPEALLEYWPPVHGDYGPLPRVTLAPGETYRYRDEIVCFSSLSYVLAEVGHYSVEVSYSADGRAEHAVHAAPLRVIVREPKGVEAEALELFDGRKQALFMARWTRERSIPEFERLAKDYPTTVYGRYARYYLAKALVDPNLGSDETTYAKAAGLFEGLVAEESGFPLTDQCMLDLAECYEFPNRRDDARAVLQKLLERFPESPVAAPAKKKLDSLQPLTPTPQVPQQADAKPEPAAAPQPKPASPASRAAPAE